MTGPLTACVIATDIRMSKSVRVYDVPSHPYPPDCAGLNRTAQRCLSVLEIS